MNWGSRRQLKISIDKEKVKLCLAAGNFRSDNNRNQIKQLFKEKGWVLFDEDWLYERIKELSKLKYEDNIVTIVTKLIFRRCPMKDNN